MPSDAYDRILNAAEERLLSDGPSGLVLDAIATDAGVSKGGLLYHFANKEALVAAICARMLDGFDESLAGQRQANVAESSEAVEEPRHIQRPGLFARAYLASTVTEDGKPADNSAQLMAGLLATLGHDSAHLETIRARFSEWHEAFAADGLDDTTATIVRLAADGLWLSALLGLPQLDPKLGRRTLEALRKMTQDKHFMTENEGGA
jgi:AcrR family transcriptional regulator